MMGRLEVQGIVSVINGLPMIQFRQLDDDDNLEAQWQASPAEARDMAQNIIEASFNAVYDAALIAWAKEVSPEDDAMGPKMVALIRQFRADKWGLPDQPKDWRLDG
jgi:hypothetical protein